MAKVIAFVLTSNLLRPDDIMKSQEKKEEDAAAQAEADEAAMQAEIQSKAAPQVAGALVGQ